jgi:hypothetical protein
MKMNSRLGGAALAAALLLLPTAILAQEEMPAERPDAGFRVLGPRTVVSFVRQSLPDGTDATGPVVAPRWTSVIHVTNAGNGPLGAAAIFVSADGKERRATRLGGIAPGQTRSLTVAQVIGDDLTNLGNVAQGVVLVRFFAPADLEADRFFATMVSAETIQERPNQPPQVIRLAVERPQPLFGARNMQRR